MRHGSRPIWLRYGDGVRKDSGYAALRAMTFLAALCCDQLTAPCVFDGPINGEGFRAYVNQQPVPTLKPDDIVIMDNPGGHKSKAVREAIKHAGARLWFLPPYSPDPNPIEQTFQRSNTGCAWHRNEQSKKHGAMSEPSSAQSPQRKAEAISKTQDTSTLKTERV